MYKCKRIFKDKGILLLSIVCLVALASIGIGMAVSQKKSGQNLTKIASIEEPGQDANGAVTKETSKETNRSTEKKTNQTAEETSTSTTAKKEAENETTAVTEPENTKNLEESGDVSSQAGAVVTPQSLPSGFSNQSIFVWPVETCDIIINFSMDSTTYFPTLDLYKTSDAVCIRSDVDSPVYAGADGVISQHNYNEELGHYIVMDLGNEYQATYGQLKDIQVAEGTTIKKGDLIGYIAEPTKYYTVEGANLYLKMTQNGTPIDPLDYLDFDKP